MTTSNPSAPCFEKVAGHCDDLRSGHFTEAVREAALRRAYLHPDMIVADVGAGTGFVASTLAPLVRYVYVLDGSPEVIAVARKNLAQFVNVEFHVADWLALPLPHASMDAVFTNMYLLHCPHPLVAIREMVRILRPGGRLVITDMDAHTCQSLKTERSDLWLGFERSRLREWFESAGLVNLVVEGTGQNCHSDRKSDAGEHADLSIFVAAGTKKVSAHESVQANYAAQALGAGCGCGDGSCCSPGTLSLDAVGTVDWNANYSPAEKADIPSEAAGFSLGCGNPIAMAGLKPGETVLDIGSGGGIDVFLAAKRVGPTGFVYGIDMTPAMLQRARETARKNGYSNVLFRHGYAENLPLEDGTVNVVISNCVINLAEDKGRVFQETFRVLTSGGRLEVNDVVFGGPVMPEVRLSAAGWSECVCGALPEQEYMDLVRQAGFVDVTVRRSTSSGTAAGVPVYSVQVSARKP